MGTRQSAGRRVAAMAARAIRVLPLPVGSTMRPRSPGELPRRERGGLIIPQTGIGPSLRRLMVAETTGVERDASLDSHRVSAEYLKAGARCAWTLASQSSPGASVRSSAGGTSLTRIVPRSNRRCIAGVTATFVPVESSLGVPCVALGRPASSGARRCIDSLTAVSACVAVGNDGHHDDRSPLARFPQSCGGCVAGCTEQAGRLTSRTTLAFISAKVPNRIESVASTPSSGGLP